MSEPIKVGDLVMVVRPMKCCAHPNHIGLIFRVAELCTLAGECDWCGAYGDAEPGADYEVGDGGGYCLYTLKRIPPPEELGMVDEKRELESLV